MSPTRDDYNEWLHNPVTKWVFRQIDSAREEVKERAVVGAGIFHANDAVKTTALSAQMIGFVQGLDELKKIQPKGKQK